MMHHSDDYVFSEAMKAAMAFLVHKVYIPCPYVPEYEQGALWVRTFLNIVTDDWRVH